MYDPASRCNATETRRRSARPTSGTGASIRARHFLPDAPPASDRWSAPRYPPARRRSMPKRRIVACGRTSGRTHAAPAWPACSSLPPAGIREPTRGCWLTVPAENASHSSPARRTRRRRTHRKAQSPSWSMPAVVKKHRPGHCQDRAGNGSCRGSPARVHDRRRYSLYRHSNPCRDTDVAQPER